MKKLILAAYIFYLPFQFKLSDSFNLNLVNIFLVLLMIILLAERQRLPIKPVFEIPLLFFLAICVFALFNTLFTVTIDMWRWEIVKDFKRIFSLVLGYFVFSRVVKTKKDLHFYFATLLFTLVLVAISTWRQGMLEGPTFADFKRSSGPFAEGSSGSDIAGGFLATFTPLLLAYSLFAQRKLLQIIGFSGFIICVFGTLATYSRGSILGLACAIVLIILLTLKYRQKLTRISTIAIVVIILGGLITWKSWFPKALLSRIEGTVTHDAYLEETTFDKGTEERIDIWKSGMELVKINPLFGIGFKKVQYTLNVDPHNSFILVLAEMGISGLLFFLLFIIGIARESGRLLKTEFVGSGIGFLGLVIAFLILNNFYANFFRDTVSGSIWIALGLLAANKRILFVIPKSKKRK